MFRDIMNSEDEEIDKISKRPKVGENADTLNKLKVNKVSSGDPNPISKESDCAYESGSED